MFEKRQHGFGGPRESSTEITPASTGIEAPTRTGLAPTLPATAPAVIAPGTGPVQSSVDIGGFANSSNTDTAISQLTMTNMVATSTPSENPALVSDPPIAASSSSKGMDLSSGAVAGVAIGALIVGALLAFLAAFFLFKRHNNKTRNGPVAYNNYSDSSPELVMLQKSAGRNSPYVQVSQTPLPVPISAPVRSELDVLPPAAQESEIQGRITALFGQIYRHIDTFYRDVHASITPSMTPELERFGAKGVDMAELLQECSSTTAIIKHALVAYVLGITGPKESDGDTLFPSQLQGVRSVETDTNPNLARAQSLYRRLSVFLYTSTSPNSTWSFDPNMRESAEHFSLTFFPWANPDSDDQEKEDSLTRIMSEALEMRIWLFGQPGEYEFRWDGVGTRGVVVRPELVMRLDGEASGRGRGKVVLESSVVAL